MQAQHLRLNSVNVAQLAAQLALHLRRFQLNESAACAARHIRHANSFLFTSAADIDQRGATLAADQVDSARRRDVTCSALNFDCRLHAHACTRSMDTHV
jgi:hypothetical protein